MKRILGVALAVILGSVSCAEDHPSTVVGSETDPSQAARTGNIAMMLTGVDEDGNTYWLRGAEFVIQSVSDPSEPPRTVSSDTDPSATSISVSLTTGLYTVTLQGNWYLELQTAQGSQQVHPALDSSAVAQVEVTANQTTEVSFRFKVKRRGTLVIGIEVVFEEVDASVGGSPDAGTTPDAGPGLDASIDAGTPPPVDAGPVADASVPALDGSLPEEEDAGEDAGPTGSVDAGGLDSGITTTP